MATERSPALRASDADREAVAQRLRAAHTDGRLDSSELDERLSATYGAKTLGDLAPLTADLGPDAPAPAPRRRSALRPWREWAGTALILNAIWIITCIAAGELIFYWPMFPLGIWAAVNLAQIFFDGDDDDREDRDRRGGLPPSPKPPEPPRLP